MKLVDMHFWKIGFAPHIEMHPFAVKTPSQNLSV